MDKQELVQKISRYYVIRDKSDKSEEEKNYYDATNISILANLLAEEERKETEEKLRKEEENKTGYGGAAI